MIVRLTHEMATLAIRIRDSRTGNLLASWRGLELIVQPGQFKYGCNPGGSPWILTGCWPGKRTGVDIANSRPDFPSIIIPANDIDGDGRIVFPIAHRLNGLPCGRYTGLIRAIHVPKEGCHRPRKLNVVPKKPQRPLPPPDYIIGADCSMPDTPPPPPPPPPCCILAVFDIDLGRACSDHYIDQAAVDFIPTNCGTEEL